MTMITVRLDRALITAGMAMALVTTVLVTTATPAVAIVGGTPATRPVPALGSLQLLAHGDPDWHICSAVLTSPRWAVTNAHCVTTPDGATRTGLHIRFGSLDRTTGGTVAEVSRVLPHAQWAWATVPGAPVADIAMLELATPVWGPAARIATRSADHGSVRVVGWGLTDPSATMLPTMLQQVDAKIRPPADCAAGDITVGELCVASMISGTGPCLGDSGSPAQHHRAMAGLTSRETAPGCTGAPVVYTDLAYYRPWMITVMDTGQVPPTTMAAPVRSWLSAA